MTTLNLIVDDAALLAKLQQLQAKLGDGLRPVLQDIGATLEARINQRFDFKRDPAGATWKPWAPSTRRQRLKEGRGELLWHGGKRSQHLRESLNYRVGDGFVEVGFAATYARFHEFGTQRMPRRGLLTANPETATLGADDQAAVLTLVRQYLER